MRWKFQALLKTPLMVGTVFAPCVSTSAFANQSPTLEEIQVTAARTGARNLQETPIAVSALQAAQIERAAITDLRDIASITPGLVIGENTGAAQIYIRGVGSNNIFAGSEPSVALYVDGVYVARPQGMFAQLMDVERIEVLRGPQGDIYGRNAAGGAINIISRRPDLTETRGALTVGYGTYNQHIVEGFLNGPLVDGKVAAAVSLLYSAHDGFRENVVPSGLDAENKDTLSGRAQLLFEASEKLSVLIRADHARDRYVPYGYMNFLEPVTAPIANSLLGDYSKVAQNFPSNGRRDQSGISLELGYKLSEDWVLTSLSAYRSNDFRLEADTDATEVNILQSFIEEEQEQFSEELTLRGSVGGLDIMAGAFLFTEDISMAGTEIRLFVPGIVRKPVPVAETRASAVYLSAQYHLNERLTAEIGLRYSHEKKDYEKLDGIFSLATGGQIANLSFDEQKRTDNVTTPKFGLNYNINDSLFIYAKASRGFKSGGFNFTAADRGSFRPEILWAYEIGAKLSLERLDLNAAAFHYDYDDLQVQAFIVPGTADITNAAAAKISGAEVEFRAAVGEGFELSGYMAYLDAEYANYGEAPISGGRTIDASGNRLNSAPRWSGAITGLYAKDVGNGELTVSADLSWQSEMFFTVDNNPVDRQSSYSLFNAAVAYSWQNGRYRVSLWGRNVFNQQYITGSASFPPSRAGRAGPPATFGARLTYRL